MFSGLVTLLLATGTVALPAGQVLDLKKPTNVTGIPGYNSTAWTPGRLLLPHEVLLFGHDGIQERAEIITEETWDLMVKRGEFVSPGVEEYAKLMNVLPFRPIINETWLNQGEKPESADEIAKRGCASVTTAITERVDNFVDWDVQMSPVVEGVGERTTVTVASGYSVANSIGVGAGLDRTLVKDILKATASIDYTYSWTTSYTASVAYQITTGYHGTIVTNPITHRRYGHIMQGCIGAQRNIGSFVADSHDQGQYAGLSWVGGQIKLCQKIQSPLTRCQGSGQFR